MAYDAVKSVEGAFMQENTANPWNKRVRRLAGHLSNVSVPLLGVVDTAVVGRLPGPEHIGAVAVATIFNVVYWAFGFSSHGDDGFHGAGARTA